MVREKITVILIFIAFVDSHGNIVLNRLKDQLNKRGASTIRGLGRVFRVID